jgi:hypothetical protein
MWSARRLGRAVSSIVAAATLVTASPSASAWAHADAAAASELLVDRAVLVNLGARQVQALDVSLQPFSESLAGASAPAVRNISSYGQFVTDRERERGKPLTRELRRQITFSGDQERPFEGDGSTFTDFESAANRACDNQKNACANAANSGNGGLRVNDCDDQSGASLFSSSLPSSTQLVG